MATLAHSTTRFRVATDVIEVDDATPHGSTRLTNTPSSSARRIASPNVTSARSGPEYSRIIASWIIVSSR